MESLLFGRAGPSDSSYICNSVDDFEIQLRNILATKTTPTKAEHINVTLSIHPSTSFVVNVPEPDSGNSSSVVLTNDTSDQGPDAPICDAPPSHTVKAVTAHAALLNQPPENPTLQEAISNSLATLVGSIDGSSWVLIDKSRSAQGWTLAYACRNSLPLWNKEHNTHSDKIVSAEYSLRAPDLVLSGEISRSPTSYAVHLLLTNTWGYI
jgi:hypothetical protein